MPNLFVASGIFPPEAGGPATYLNAILPALLACGWQLRVLTYGAGDQQDYPYPVTRIARRALPLRRARYAMAAVSQLAWADIVYAHTIDLPLVGWRRPPRVIKIVGDQAWERCRRRGWIPPDISIDDFQAYQGDARVRWQKRSRDKQLAAMDGIIVPSRYLKRLVRSWGVDESKIEVIYNALPRPAPPAQSRAEVRAALGWADQPTLIAVARLQPWKGIDHVIGAMRDLADTRLVVVGDGPESARLRALAQPLGNRVRFTGQLPAAQVRRMIYAADGLVLYSSYEGLSHTLLESLQLGTPVLSSDVGGNAEIVRSGVNGILAPHLDLAALRNGLRQLLTQRETLAQNCAYGMERFDFSRMVERTNKYLRARLPDAGG